MKKIFKYTMLLVVATMILASCSDDRDSNPVLQQPTSFVLNTPAYASQPIDLASSDSLIFTWSQPDYGFPAVTNYTIEFSGANDWSVSNIDADADESGETIPTYYINDNSVTVCDSKIAAKTINRALVHMMKYTVNSVPDKQKLYVRVKANTKGTKDIYSNVDSILVAPYYAELKPADPVLWYLVGNCIGSSDWDNGAGSVGTGLIPLLPQPSVEFDDYGNGTLLYAGYFPEGGQFKFVKYPGDWGTQMNFTNIDGNTAGATDEDGDNHNIGIPEDGFYKITMNTVQGKFSIEKLDGTYPEFTSMGIPGEHNEWNTSGNPLTAMGKRDNTQAHDWMGEITLDNAGKFKIAADGSWDVNWGGTDFPLGYGTKGGADIVAKPGKYAVYFNDVLGLYYFKAIE